MISELSLMCVNNLIIGQERKKEPHKLENVFKSVIKIRGIKNKNFYLQDKTAKNKTFKFI